MKEYKEGVAYVESPWGRYFDAQNERMQGLKADIDKLNNVIQVLIQNNQLPAEVRRDIKPELVGEEEKKKAEEAIIAERRALGNYSVHIISEDDNEWIVDSNFILTHINRCNDNLDVIDTAIIPYSPSLVQLRVNDREICNIDFDIAMLSNNAEYKLPFSLNFKPNDRVVLEKGTGTGIKIALHGRRVELPISEKQRLPYFFAVNLDKDDIKNDIVIPSYMKDIRIHSAWTFKRVKPSDSTKIYYLSYNDEIVSTADGKYNGDFLLNIRYRAERGEQHILRENTLASNWTGTRENIGKISNLSPRDRSFITVLTNAETVPATALVHKWLILGISYIRI